MVLEPATASAASPVDVTVVYDAVDGGARKWDPIDFSFDAADDAVSTLQLSVAGATATASENRCVVTIDDAENCRVEITGLDPRRDVMVDVTRARS